MSRGGLLVQASQPLRPGHPLWVTFPFDSENTSAQPESVARVLRCMKTHDLAAPWSLAVQFAGVPISALRQSSAGRKTTRAQNGNGHGTSVALPIRVRPDTFPWHEEAMTVEVSSDKLKFQTNREYQFGDTLLISFAVPADLSGNGPLHGDGEWETEVIGIETTVGSDLLQVTVQRKSESP